MSNPNMANAISIIGDTISSNVSTVGEILITNASDSNSIIKVNALYISNIDTSNTTEISVGIVRSGIGYSLFKGINIPPNTSLDAISKSFYLKEGDSLSVSANANSMSQATVSYETIS